jgi:hypothetical protein
MTTHIRLFNSCDQPLPAANTLKARAIKALVPITESYHLQGYSQRDVAYILEQVIHSLTLSNILGETSHISQSEKDTLATDPNVKLLQIYYGSNGFDSNFVASIKEYRKMTGASLVDAKNYIENLTGYHSKKPSK